MARLDRTRGSGINTPSPNTSPGSDIFKDAPWVSDELLVYLEGHFPDRLPDPPSKKAMYKRIGWREVVSHLKTLHKAQTS